jgi:hypothetical protein
LTISLPENLSRTDREPHPGKLLVAAVESEQVNWLELQWLLPEKTTSTGRNAAGAGQNWPRPQQAIDKRDLRSPSE